MINPHMEPDENIRIATSFDGAAIMQLYNSDASLFGEPDSKYEIDDILEYIHDERKKMLVYVKGDLIIGALLAEYHNTYVYLDSIIVEKEFQGKGIGKKLMNSFEVAAKEKGLNFIEVLTETTNTKMKAFLESKKYKKGGAYIYYFIT